MFPRPETMPPAFMPSPADDPGRHPRTPSRSTSRPCWPTPDGRRVKASQAGRPLNSGRAADLHRAPRRGHKSCPYLKLERAKPALTRHETSQLRNDLTCVSSKEVGRKPLLHRTQGQPPPRTCLRPESPSATGALVGPPQGKEFPTGRRSCWPGRPAVGCARACSPVPRSRGGGDGGGRLPGRRGRGRVGGGRCAAGSGPGAGRGGSGGGGRGGGR